MFAEVFAAWNALETSTVKRDDMRGHLEAWLLKTLGAKRDVDVEDAKHFAEFDKKYGTAGKCCA